MEKPSYIVFTLSLTESSGRSFQVGAPNLFYWLNVAYLPNTPLNDGKVSIVSRDRIAGAWSENSRSVSFEQAQAIIELIKELGMPERTPEVEGIIDTSDNWTQISFQFRADEQSLNLEVALHSSGFQGKDAARLRKLFRYLFSLADYADYDRSIYGF